ncbi:hypothetical protein KIN20_029508 [Parelaphostrongylus tenuis]|uniref:Uncharacterized protein n=1 Tax=Parelaphostrongylus tenuis TaxID=148309 RepID=A0AAD5R2G4_PARTN|nr:hypothetical protein KIN20_029508 [Parelaphostrongylus tenuis]
MLSNFWDRQDMLWELLDNKKKNDTDIYKEQLRKLQEKHPEQLITAPLQNNARRHIAKSICHILEKWTKLLYHIHHIALTYSIIVSFAP